MTPSSLHGTIAGPRRLAAILVADVVGYSRLMSADEAGTLHALIHRNNTILAPLVEEHHGRLVKSMGDGVLVEFASAVNAVECAMVYQSATRRANWELPEERRILVRIGINIGDIMVAGGDIFGEGVNVAARLEALAEPGSVVVSEVVVGQVRGRVKYQFDDLGTKNLKNIADPVRVYRVSAPASRLDDVPHTDKQSSKPSLAILPFVNLSGNAEQDYFSDGITEDIITDLSQVSALSLVSHRMAFAFKGKQIELSQVAHKLNVRYLLEGSVRRAGNRLRISAQLVDGMTGSHLWADRYDRELGDVFELQDDITRCVVTALKVKLLPEESRLVADRSTSNAAAYEFYLQGRAKFFQSWGNVAMLKSARELFTKAVEVDSGYAKAYTGIADCDAFLWINGELDISFDELLAMSAKALSLAPNMAEAHACRGMALHVAGRTEEAAAAFERAVTLDPLLFGAHLVYALNCRDRGDVEKAAALFERAAELRSDDYAALTLLANVYELQGDFELSKQTARRSLIRIESTLERNPNSPEVLGFGAATLVYLGENARAMEWAERAIVLEPGNYAVRYNVACAYAVLGRADAALEQLEYIVSQVPRARQWLLKSSRNDPQLNALRDKPDFHMLMARIAADMMS